MRLRNRCRSTMTHLAVCRDAARHRARSERPGSMLAGLTGHQSRSITILIQARTRPERPTAERLDRFTQLERDRVRRTSDSVPVRIR
jgi:hypothetical protein